MTSKKTSKEFVEGLSDQGREFCIIGLTGKVRSGTSDVCNLLTQQDFLKCMDLPQNIVEKGEESREYRIIYRYLKENWKPFVELDVTSVIVSYFLDLGADVFQNGSGKEIAECATTISNVIKKLEDNSEELELFYEKAFKRVKNVYMALNYITKTIDEKKIEKEITQKFSDYRSKIEKFNNLFEEWENTKFQIEKEDSPSEALDLLIFCFGVLPELASRIKTCFKETRLNDEETYLKAFQDFGNSIRATGSVESVCFKNTKLNISANNLFSLPVRINQFIKVLRKSTIISENKFAKTPVFVVINNFKNIFEAYYFKRRYSAFYLMAVSCEENFREKKFQKNDKFYELNLREDLSAGKKIYKAALKSNSYQNMCESKDSKDKKIDDEYKRELGVNTAEINFIKDILHYDNELRRKSYEDNYAPFILQDVITCIENADIFVTRDFSESDYKYDHQLIRQLARVATLILHPGLLVPTKIERCMQIAMTAKLNSGCLSRQVGAVVTDRNYNILSLGWNDAPCGAETCIRRNFFDLARKSDKSAYSDYELKNKEFRDYIEVVNTELRSHKDELKGLPMAFCFKDIHQDLIKQRDQIYTRALHGEERALASCNNNLADGGYLFTTSSPCELCAKRAKEAGISRIYYIQLYPGISKDHVIEIGPDNTRTDYEFFVGAVKLYTPLIPYKDELAAFNFSPSDTYKIIAHKNNN